MNCCFVSVLVSGTLRNPLTRYPLWQPSRSGFETLCGSLGNLFHLRQLFMSDAGIGDGETKELAAYVTSSVRLELLDVSSKQTRCYCSRSINHLLLFTIDKSRPPFRLKIDFKPVPKRYDTALTTNYWRPHLIVVLRTTWVVMLP